MTFASLDKIVTMLSSMNAYLQGDNYIFTEFFMKSRARNSQGIKNEVSSGKENPVAGG
jgi:hypothetical protein